MSNSITFAVWGPQNTLRVRFLKRPRREYNSSSPHSTPFGRCTNQTHFFCQDYPRIGHRPCFATVEYGGTFSFCRCVHSVGGITRRDGQVFSKISWLYLYIWSSAWRGSVYAICMHWLTCRDPRRTPRRDDTASPLKCSLSLWCSWP